MAFFSGGGDERNAHTADAIQRRTVLLADTMLGDHLFGSKVGVADFYSFVMLLRAKKRKLGMPERLAA